MNIRVYNNYAEFDYTDSLEEKSFLNRYLTCYVKEASVDKFGKFRFRDVERRLYTKIKKKVFFPRGIIECVKEVVKGIDIEDLSVVSLTVPEIDDEEIRKILQPESNFDLRRDQVLAVKKGLINKRGVIQMPPGSGKTEVQAAILKSLMSVNNNLHFLIIEPTLELGKSTCQRLKRYNIDSSFYSDERSVNYKVVVAHVSSLLNDLKSNPSLLDSFNGVFFDESHHLRSDTWFKLNFSLKNIEYSLGFSALAINEEHIIPENFDFCSYDERLVLGCSGRVLFHVNSSHYINKGILATPVVFQLRIDIPKEFSKVSYWPTLLSSCISSNLDRNKIISDSASLFNSYGRKVLILVATKEQAFNLAEIYSNSGGGSYRLGISFGNKESYTIDKGGDLKDYLDGSILKDFDDGKISTLMATTHLDEGIDISQLDVCILAAGGKKDRRLIQRIGRVLRKTKKGKYAYIIDFSDSGNKVLSRHASFRSNLYKNLIEVPEDKIFKNYSFEVMREKFKQLEGVS